MANGKHDCGYNPDRCENHTTKLVGMETFLREFVARYDDDRRECRDRYVREWEETVQWRNRFSERLSVMETFIGELKPNYKRGMAFIGAIIIGAVALIWKIVWNHVSGGK
jgi:hypothetical protein